jgi:hypothetical protein
VSNQSAAIHGEVFRVSDETPDSGLCIAPLIRSGALPSTLARQRVGAEAPTTNRQDVDTVRFVLQGRAQIHRDGSTVVAELDVREDALIGVMTEYRLGSLGD